MQKDTTYGCGLSVTFKGGMNMNYYGYFKTIPNKNGDPLRTWKQISEDKVNDLNYMCCKYNCYNPKYIPVELLRRVLCNECNATEFNNVKSCLKYFDIDMMDNIDIVASKHVIRRFLQAGCKVIGCKFDELPWMLVFQNLSEIYYFTKCIFEDVFTAMPETENKERNYKILRKSLYSSALTQAEIGHHYNITGSWVGQMEGNMLLRMWGRFQRDSSSKIIKRLLTYVVKDTTCEEVYGLRTFETFESRKRGNAILPLVDRIMDKYTKRGLIEPIARVRHSETGDKIYDRKEGETIHGSYTSDYYDLYY